MTPLLSIAVALVCVVIGLLLGDVFPDKRLRSMLGALLLAGGVGVALGSAA